MSIDTLVQYVFAYFYTCCSNCTKLAYDIKLQKWSKLQNSRWNCRYVRLRIFSIQ